MDKPSEKNLVVQSNAIIESKYNLNLEAQRLLRILISMIKPEDEKFEGKFYRLHVKDIQKILEGVTSNKNIYERLRGISKKLMSTPIEWYDEKMEKLMQTTWLSSATYHFKEGYIDFEFSSVLERELLKLKKFFTQYQLKNVVRFKSKYSIRVYELLMLHFNQFNPEFVYNLDDLQKMLGSNYPQYPNFRQRVLEVAKKEILSKTTIKYEYVPIKWGRRVNKIKFIIHKKKSTKDPKIAEFKKEAADCWRKSKGNCAVFRYGTITKESCEFCPGRKKSKEN